MVGALDGVGNGPVPLHQLLRIDQIVVRLVAVFQRALPEISFFLRAAPEGQHHGQGDLPFAEIIAHALAERGLLAGIIQRIIDKLENDAKIAAIGFKCRLFVPRPCRR